MESILACGPYFGPDGLVVSGIIFLVLKPLAYFAFIQAFRYRVARCNSGFPATITNLPSP